MNSILIVVLVFVALGVFSFVALFIFRQAQKLQAQLTLSLTQNSQAQQSQIEDSLTRSRMELRQNLQMVTTDLQTRLESVRNEVDKKLTQTSQQNFESLESVSRRLEELHTVTGQVVGLTQGVRDLSKILETPKLRGAMGEFALHEMLRDILPDDAYELQVAIDKKSKEMVDAVIKLKEGWLCIDSKFPLTQARRIFDEKLTEPEIQEARKLFAADIKVMVDSIAGKYIIPDKTLDFAFMFIPAESVYYELMRDSVLHQYCLKKHVIPVSPNSFYAYLQAIAIGFRGLKIQTEAKKIESVLLKLKSDFQKFSADFEKVGKHLKDAQTQYQNVEDRVGRFGVTIDRLGLSSEPAPELVSPTIPPA